jgi:hypothetical protein
MLTYFCFLCSAPSFYSKLWSKVVAAILAQRELQIQFAFQLAVEMTGWNERFKG